MCWYDEDGGFVDDGNIYGSDIDATKYDIERKRREEEELNREIESEEASG